MSTYVSSAGSLSEPFVEPESYPDGSTESAGGALAAADCPSPPAGTDAKRWSAPLRCPRRIFSMTSR